MSDIAQLFRLNIEVADLDAAQQFYETLFGAQGRRQAGGRFYLNAGPVALQIVDVSAQGKPHTAAKALYFSTTDLDAIHARAASLQCLSDDRVHGLRAGDVSVKPWGERSFYAHDTWGNPLCFVDAGTIYAG